MVEISKERLFDQEINRVLGVILIGNNLVNISASALLTFFVIKKFGVEYVWIGTLLLTIFIWFWKISHCSEINTSFLNYNF